MTPAEIATLRTLLQPGWSAVNVPTRELKTLLDAAEERDRLRAANTEVRQHWAEETRIRNANEAVLRSMQCRLAEVEAENAHLVAALRAVKDCGVAFDDKRLDWVEVQIDRVTVALVNDALRPYEEPKNG